MKLPPPITNKTFEERISKWLKTITSGESACILFCPKMDRHRRIYQLLNSPDIIKKYLDSSKKYKFLTIDFDNFPVEDLEDLGDNISSGLNMSDLGRKFKKFSKWRIYLKIKKISLILLVLNAERLFQKQNQSIFLFLASLVENEPLIKALLFFEKDITHPETLKIISARTAILQNIVYYPLYTKEDVRQFIYYLGCKWDFKIPEKITLAVIKECGGHFLLVKEAIRFLRAFPKAPLKKIFDHEEMMMRLEWICDGFSETEREVLKKISFGETSFNSNEKHSFSYLKKIGALNKKGSLTIPLLGKYLKKAEDKTSQVTLKNDEILLNNVPIKIFFSRQEYRVLKELLRNKGKLVTRDEIAKHIWPTDTDKNYSDWAIDQLMRRLRKKLAKLYISQKVLKTVRSQGYLLAFE